MKQLKPHFVYNKKQRNGVFWFLLVVACIQFTYYLLNNRVVASFVDTDETIGFRQYIDSLKVIKKNTVKVYKFNPNFITDEKGYGVGMSVAEIDRLLSYRRQNKWINSSEDFQRITKVSDSLLGVLKPLFLFPKKSFQKVKKKKKRKTIVVSKKEKSGINTATATGLKKVYGVGDKLSARIVAYRNRLGGYSNINQLDEVYGLKEQALTNVKLKYAVVNAPVIEKLDINKATFKEVLSIVYLDYETTKLIFNYKDSVNEIVDLQEIKKIAGFPIDKYDRIALYLHAE